MSRHSLDSLEQPHESPGFVAPENLIEESRCCKEIWKWRFLPDTVPFSSCQPGVKCSHAGREPELEMISPSMESPSICLHNISRVKLLKFYHSFAIGQSWAPPFFILPLSLTLSATGQNLQLFLLLKVRKISLERGFGCRWFDQHCRQWEQLTCQSPILMPGSLSR